MHGKALLELDYLPDLGTNMMKDGIADSMVFLGVLASWREVRLSLV